MTAEDDDYFADTQPQRPFVPPFCPLMNLQKLMPHYDLICVSCGKMFESGKEERVTRNCGYQVELR